MKLLNLSLPILFLSFGSLAQAQTQYITTADGAGGDIYIKSGMTNRQNTLQVKNAERAGGDPHVTTKTYLKFDLSDFSSRLSEIENAGLHLTTRFNHLSSDGPPAALPVFVYGLTDETLDDWNENEVVWTDAPANDATSNGLDMEKVVALGQIDVPANPEPDPVSFMSQELADFIASDTNGTITLILRREDTSAGNNLWFYSKEDLIGGSMSDAPTLEIVLPINPDAIVPFDLVVEGDQFRGNFYDSSWFGRFEYNENEIARNGLGHLWTGAVNNDASMFLWSWSLDQWIWTAKSCYPYVYLMNDQEWVYALTDPSAGTFVWRYETTDWMDFNNTGWEYPFTNQELVTRLNANIAAVPHPRILLNLEEIPTLREKVSDGWLMTGYERMKLASDLMISDNDTDIAYGPTIGRAMQNIISSMALLGYMEEDPSYHRFGIDFTLRQMERFTDEEFEYNNAGSPHLGLGDVIHAFAIAYDWLYPAMSESERFEIRSKLETLASLQFDNVKTIYNGASSSADSSNHNAVANGGLGLAAMALGDQPIYMEQAIRQVRNYLEFSSDDEGWNFEGTHYFGYGGWGAFPFSTALYSLGGPDLLAEQPKYDSVAVDYFLRRMPPYGGIGGIGAAMPFIVRSQDRVGLWVWLHVNGEDGNATYGGVGSNIYFWTYTLLWADPDLEPLEPIYADLPLDKVFPSDRATFRDGWGQMDSVVTMTTGWTAHSGHRMRSDNSFEFYTLGERFSIAPNDASTRMEVLHSLVMVDEPRRTRAAGEYPYGADFESVVTDENFAFVRSNATESVVYYEAADGWTSPDKRKVTEAVRHLLFARSPEGLSEPYMLVIDDLTARAESAKFSWLLQTAAGNTVDLGESGNAFQIIGENYGNLLDVEFLAPAIVSNEFISHVGRDEIKGRWSDERIAETLTTISTSTVGKSVRFIALLRAHEAGTSAPSYTFTGTDTNGVIVVVLSDGTTDTLTINGNEIGFSRVAL